MTTLAMVNAHESKQIRSVAPTGIIGVWKNMIARLQYIAKLIRIIVEYSRQTLLVKTSGFLNFAVQILIILNISVSAMTIDAILGLRRVEQSKNNKAMSINRDVSEKLFLSHLQ